MKNFYKLIYLLYSIQIVFFISDLTAQEKYNKLSKAGSIAKTTGTPSATLLNINNISGWIYDDGMSGASPDGSSGIWYPKGTASVIYLDGLFWGGYVQDSDPSKPSLRVGGQQYRIGTTPGRIISNGIAQSPDDPDVHIYRIRKDWQTVSDAELSLDACDLYNMDLSKVTQSLIDAVRDQYEENWNEWPAEYGAPFYDINNNGIYEPSLGEEPGLQNADQVIWFVCNDLDSNKTKSFAGSPPIGLEVQVTLWAYKVEGALGQTQFRRFRFINKSGFAIDSMYVGQFSDPDLGSAGDDLVGCDTLLNMGYCYNGYQTDAEFAKYELPPVAIGYALLQGPLVSSQGDNANYNFQNIPGSKNIEMTSFYYNDQGEGWWDVTNFTGYGGTLAWYNVLRGYTPTIDIEYPVPYYEGCDFDKPTKFPLAGDPVTGVGDIDGEGNNYSPSDRIMGICTGPFSMAPGETQEIVIALVGGINPFGDHLTSITEMKENVQYLRSIYPALGEYAKTSYSTTFPSKTETKLSVVLDFKSLSAITSAELVFESLNGSEADFNISLFDDGLHNDLQAGDNTWGNSITLSNRKHTYNADLNLQTSEGQKFYPNMYSEVCIRPKPQLVNGHVVWENGRQDSKINNGEKVHIAYDLYNPDGLNSIEGLQIGDIKIEQSISPGALYADNTLVFKVNASTEGDSTEFCYPIQFDKHRDYIKVKHPMEYWNPAKFWGDTLVVISVTGMTENTIPIVADRSLLTGHDYSITFVDTGEDSLVWRLTDLTSREVKLDHFPLIEDSEFPFPVIDGIQWQVSEPPYAIEKSSYISGESSPLYPDYEDGRWFDGSSLHGAGLFGCLGITSIRWDGYNSGFSTLISQLPDVEIVFTPMTGFTDDDGDGTYDPGESYQFNVSEGSKAFMYSDWGAENYLGFFNVPFQVFDISNTGNPRRLNIVVMDLEENNQWDIHEADTFYNFAWIMSTDYDETGKTYNPNEGGIDYFAVLSDGFVDAYYKMLLNRSGDRPFLAEGSTCRISLYKHNQSGDSLLVKAPTVNTVDLNAPEAYELHQNYPNPFNPETRIDVSLKKESVIDIEIYNILGQKVKTLVKNESLLARKYEYTWNARNDYGNPVSSGIYFYRLNVNSGEFVSVKKMLLVK